jgi:hypothetical protein
VKIEITAGQIYTGTKTYSPGDIADFPDFEAERLIYLGVAKRSGAPAPNVANNNADPPKTAEEIAAEAAAKKHQKTEAAAVKKGLGTTEEVAALSDEDLQSLFKAGKK